MEVNQIKDIVLACILSAGGISGIIILAVKFSSNFIADRLSSKYEIKLQKELEKYKSNIETKKSISKAMFDKEYEIYVAFNKEFAILYNEIQTYHGIKNDCDITTAQEIKNWNINDFQKYIDNNNVVTDIQMENFEKEMISSSTKLRELLGYSGAFIPRENWILLQGAYNACYQYLLSKRDEDFQIVIVMMGKMQNELRSYLEQLIVIE